MTDACSSCKDEDCKDLNCPEHAGPAGTLDSANEKLNMVCAALDKLGSLEAGVPAETEGIKEAAALPSATALSLGPTRALRGAGIVEGRAIRGQQAKGNSGVPNAPSSLS